MDGGSRSCHNARPGGGNGIGKDMALRLLIVDDSVEAAEAIVSGLRNTGIAVRPSRPENEARARRAAQRQPLDLVLAARDAEDVPLRQVMQAGRRQRQGPAGAAAGRRRRRRRACWKRWTLGARGVVLRERIDHIQSTVRAEWADLEARRALRRLEAQVRETERRCDALIDSSRDPIAYVHEGMHIRANAAYLEMFGYESFEDIEGMSLLDLIAPQHVDELQAAAQAAVQGRGAAAALRDSRRATLDGSHFPAVMEFTAATYEGESLPAGRAAPQAGVRPGTGPRGRGTAPARPGHRPAQPRDLPARARGRGRRHRRTTPRHHGLLLIEPDHYARLLQDIGLDAADDLVAALRRPPAQRARRRTTSPRASASTSSPCSAATATTQRTSRWPKPCAPRSPTTCSKPTTTRSTPPSASAACRSARRSPASPRPGQGQPGPAVDDRRRRQPHRAVRPRRRRPRRGRTRRSLGHAHPRSARRRPASSCTTSR